MSDEYIGNGSVKVFVALYKGIPIELEDDTYLPQTAVEIIKKNNKSLTDEQLKFLERNEIDIR